MAELQADTSADLDGRKTSTLSCLCLGTLSGSSDWRIQLDPLLMRWSMHRYGEHHMGSQITPRVDGEGSHRAGLGALSGNHVGAFTVEVDVPLSIIIPSYSL